MAATDDDRPTDRDSAAGTDGADGGPAAAASIATDDTASTAPDASASNTPDDSHSHSADHGGLASLRARDAVTLPRDELAAQLSAAEIEQLSRWFGLPSFTQIAEDGEPGADDAIADFDSVFANVPGFYIAPEEIKRTLEARRQAMAAVEPALLDHLERHLGAGDALLRFHPSLQLAIAPERFERRFVTHAAIDVTEQQTPEWLADSMRECVPQALLRDLHRPEQPAAVDNSDLMPEPPPSDPMDEVRATLGARYRFVPTPPALAQADQALAERAATMASPWSEIRTPNRRVTE